MVFAWLRLNLILVESRFNGSCGSFRCLLNLNSTLLLLCRQASPSANYFPVGGLQFSGQRTRVLKSTDSSSPVSGILFSSQRNFVLRSVEFCSPVSGILFPGQRNFVPWSEKTFFLVREIIFSSQRKNGVGQRR